MLKGSVSLILFGVVVLAMTGCVAVYDQITRPRMVILSENRRFPSKPEFTIKPAAVREGAGIGFDAIYYLANDRIHGVQAPGGNYYRFWSNGRVLVNMSSGFPTRAEVEDFTHAYLGYYRLVNNRLEMEFFAPDSAKWRWDYRRVFAKLSDGSLIELHSRRDDFEIGNLSSYLKYSFGRLERKPDW
jgi:hypothetical protein